MIISQNSFTYLNDTSVIVQNILRYTNDQLYRIEASAEGQTNKKKPFWVILRVKISSTRSGDGSYTDHSSDENRWKKVKKNINVLSFIYWWHQ